MVQILPKEEYGTIQKELCKASCQSLVLFSSMILWCSVWVVFLGNIQLMALTTCSIFCKARCIHLGVLCPNSGRTKILRSCYFQIVQNVFCGVTQDVDILRRIL